MRYDLTSATMSLVLKPTDYRFKKGTAEANQEHWRKLRMLKKLDEQTFIDFKDAFKQQGLPPREANYYALIELGNYYMETNLELWKSL